MGKRNELRRRDALKVLGCAACAVAVATPACTFSELYEDFEGETVEVDLSDDEFSALQALDGMVAIDVGPVKLNLIRATETELVAIERICPHLQEDMAPVGSSPNARGIYSDGSLICTVHGSQFDLSGMPIAGPSNVGLQRFPVDFRPEEQDGMATLYIGVEPPPGVMRGQ